MKKETFSVAVAYIKSRRTAKSPRIYEVHEVITGLDHITAKKIYQVFHGRLHGYGTVFVQKGIVREGETYPDQYGF